MQSILVPTDYSENAKNATEYAIQLSKRAKSKIIFFHAFHVPVPGKEELPETSGELGSINLQKIKNYSAALHSLNGDVEMDYLVKPGFAVDQILNYSKQNKIDLIIMGAGNASIGDKLMGSVVTNLIKKIKIPVLVIPEKVKFKDIKKIVLAYDYSEITNLHVLDTLKAIVDLFQSQIMVVNVLKNEKSILKKTGSSNILENFLANIDHSFHFPVNRNIVEGINQFVDNSEAELYAIIPHKHSGVQRLFHKSSVKRIALHPHLPLLVLPG